VAGGLHEKPSSKPGRERQVDDDSVYATTLGILAFDTGAYENIEADPSAGWQALAVVLLVCAASGFALASWSVFSVSAFASATVATVGAWVVWVVAIRLIGIGLMSVPETRSSTPELLRTLGFAGAPGLFYAFGAFKPAAPFILVLVSLWTIATSVMAVRQALDYRSTARANLVCVVAWLLSFGILAVIGLALSKPVS